MIEKKVGVTVRMAEKAPLLNGIIRVPFVVVASAKMQTGAKPELSTSMEFYRSMIVCTILSLASFDPPRSM